MVRYRFGEHELDVEAYTLTRGGSPLHVTPKVFDLLRHLIEGRGRVVTKEELLDTLWADSHVNEGAVPWAVNHARAALGQKGRAKAPIETIYGRGYRFVAEVEVLGERPSAPPAQATPETSPDPWLDPPFVGRESVMTGLRERLASAEAGRGGLCTLVGSAGIGKTRCMEELAANARDQGIAVWAGRTSEDGVAPALWPWTQVLVALVREQPALQTRGQELLDRLRSADPPGPGDAPGGGAGATFWFFEGVSELLQDAARSVPVLMLLDDLQWADEASLQLLAFLAPDLARMRVLVVSARRGGEGRTTRALRRLSRHVERVALEPFTPEEVGRYVDALAPSSPAEELASALHRASAGNPLFLLHTVRGLIAQHGAAALGALDPERIQPAESARAVLRAGIERLDGGTREVLETASVVGEVLDVATLRSVTGLEPEPLLEAIEQAVTAQLLVADSPSRYRFRHALLRGTLYEALSPGTRARIHDRIADTLSRRSADRSRLAEIAHHRYRALSLGEPAQVAAAATEAARAAARLQAFTDAATFYGWALEAQALDPETRPRDRAELLLARAQQQGFAGRGADAQRTVAELEELGREQGYWDLLVRAARVLRPSHLMAVHSDERARELLEQARAAAPEGAGRVRISALSQLALIPPYALEMGRSKELAGQALTLARELDDDVALFEALHAQLYAQSGPDDIDALLGIADEMIARDRTPVTWVTMEALAASHGALILRGDLSAAGERLAAMGRIARRQQWAEALWSHDRMAAQRRLLEGDFATAEAAFADLDTRARRLGLAYGPRLIGMMRLKLSTRRDGVPNAGRGLDPAVFFDSIHDVMPSMRPGLSRLCLRCGQRELARSVLETMVGDTGSDLPREVGYLNAVANLALIAVELGDAERAERLYDELAPYPHYNTPTCLMWFEGSVSHALAALAVLLKRGKRAGAHFDDAMAMNEQLGLRPLLAETTYRYARFVLSGARSPARRRVGLELRGRAVALGDELGMGWLADLARGLDAGG